MIYDLINSCVYVVLANIFLSTFIKEKIQSIYFKISLSMVWAISGVILSMLFPENLVVRIVVAIILNIIFANILYSGKKIHCSVLAVLFYVIVIGCDLLIVSIQKRIDPVLRIDTIMQNSISVYMGVLSQLFQLLIILVLRRWFQDSKNVILDSKMWLIYAIFPLYSISLIVLIGYSYDGPINQFQTNVFTYVEISLLVLNLLVYWFIKQEIKRTLLSQKEALELAHAKEAFKIYEQISRERDILGKREHEYKNTITVLHRLSQNGHFDEVIKILEDQNTELINNANVVETGNRLISTILNAKYVEARGKGITVRFIPEDLSSFSINERDGIIIFSNILNNAIEAAEKCTDNHRVISIKTTIEDDQFVFSVRNTCTQQTIGLKSEKNDVVSHGYGLNNIREAVARNNGICYFESEANEFISVVILPI